jgi:hypothetical protein
MARWKFRINNHIWAQIQPYLMKITKEYLSYSLSISLSRLVSRWWLLEKMNPFNLLHADFSMLLQSPASPFQPQDKTSRSMDQPSSNHKTPPHLPPTRHVDELWGSTTGKCQRKRPKDNQGSRTKLDHWQRGIVVRTRVFNLYWITFMHSTAFMDHLYVKYTISTVGVSNANFALIIIFGTMLNDSRTLQ